MTTTKKPPRIPEADMRRSLAEVLGCPEGEVRRRGRQWQVFTGTEWLAVYDGILAKARRLAAGKLQRGNGRGRMAGAPGATDLAARPRKKHSKKQMQRFSVRFGTHLRSLMDARGWQTADLASAMADHGADIGKPTIQKWLRGGGCPHEDLLEPLGKALGLGDYRLVLPPSE